MKESEIEIMHFVANKLEEGRVWVAFRVCSVGCRDTTFKCVVVMKRKLLFSSGRISVL